MGRYEFHFRSKTNLIFNHLSKSIIVLFLNIFFGKIIFRIFWDWDLMNFQSFTNFTNQFTSCMATIFFLSITFQLSINIFSLRINKKKIIWIFWGDQKREEYFKTLLNKRSNLEIELLNNKEVNIKDFNSRAIIIDYEKDFAKNNIKFLFA